jgi:hypothetical protein
MKQYLSSEQTAKMIEMGFEKPKSEVECDLPKGDWRIGAVGIRKAYSIGELIEMLPEAICESNDDDYHYFLSIETDSLTWKVFYESEDEVTLCSTFGVELVDALCSMLTILKRQGTL